MMGFHEVCDLGTSVHPGLESTHENAITVPHIPIFSPAWVSGSRDVEDANPYLKKRGRF